MKLQKGAVKTIPFRPGSPISFQEGLILDDLGEPWIRYTRSMEVVRKGYRITLQYLKDENFTPYVFDLAGQMDEEFEVHPDSLPAQEIWSEPTSSTKKIELEAFLKLIFQEDISSSGPKNVD